MNLYEFVTVICNFDILKFVTGYEFVTVICNFDIQKFVTGYESSNPTFSF
jgi:hypothetical protein